MTFAHPYLLLFLAGLPLLAWLLGRRGAQPAFLYSSVRLVRAVAGHSPSRPGFFRRQLRWLILALFIIALARPQIDQSDTQVRASGVDIVAVLDLSGSMRAEDFQVNGQRINRVQMARRVLQNFIKKRPSDRIGLVAFSGRAYVAAPLTLDHDFLLTNLERLQFGTIKEQGTAIGAGLATALNRLRDQKSKSKIVILMTDGQEDSPPDSIQPRDAADAAQALGIKVYTIGVGTRGEAPVPVLDRFTRRTVYEMQRVDIDEKCLTDVAKVTGGKYYRADNAEAFEAIYAEIDRLEKTEVIMSRFQQFEELFAWVVLPGLGLLLAEIVLTHTLWRRLP